MGFHDVNYREMAEHKKLCEETIKQNIIWRRVEEGRFEANHKNQKLILRHRVEYSASIDYRSINLTTIDEQSGNEWKEFYVQLEDLHNNRLHISYGHKTLYELWDVVTLNWK